MFLALHISETFLGQSVSAEIFSSAHVLRWDAALVGPGGARVCFGGGRRAVAFLPLLSHCVKSLLTDVLQKVNAALWFCGSSVFLNEALSWPVLNILRVLISPLFCWFTSPIWFRKWQEPQVNLPFPATEAGPPEASLALASTAWARHEEKAQSSQSVASIPATF